MTRTDVVSTGDSVSTVMERKTAFTIRNTMTTKRSSFFIWFMFKTLFKRTQFKYSWNTTSCWMVPMSVTKLSDWELDTPLQCSTAHKNFKCFCNSNGEILHVLYEDTTFRHSKSTVAYTLIGGRQPIICILKKSPCKLAFWSVQYFCYLYGILLF